MTQTPVTIPYRCCEHLQVYSDSNEKAIFFRHKDVSDVFKVPWIQVELYREGVIKGQATGTAPEVIAEAWVWEAHRTYENKYGARIPGN